MRKCEFCRRMPCECKQPEKFDCQVCSYRGLKSEMRPIDNARGFISHWVCRNSSDCAMRCVALGRGK
jgi:hypothetical protein